MRRAHVFYNGILAGELTEFSPNEYVFRYDDGYFADPKMPAVSLPLPKTQQEYHAPHLFPYFYNLLSEGTNRALQSRLPEDRRERQLRAASRHCRRRHHRRDNP